MKKKVYISLVGALTGSILGYIYYHYFGCKSGCMISSNPYTMVVYGMFSGFLISSNFFETKFNNKKDLKNE
jgi:hypothetical protein